MKFFPTICVDDFFDNPDEIRRFALSLDYPENLADYPGKRTKDLKEIDFEFYRNFCRKITELFFKTQADTWNMELKFQQIAAMDPSKDSLKNRGWVHRDERAIVSGIVYLNPSFDLDGGTSIYKKINHSNDHDHLHKKLKATWAKKEFYLNGHSENYEQHYSTWHEDYIETARFGNVYNRLVAFESSQYHAAGNYHSDQEPRLTLVFFLNSIEPVPEPYLRSARTIACPVQKNT